LGGYYPTQMSALHSQAARAGARPVLSAGFAALALSIQEAASIDELSASDTSRRLSSALQDAARENGGSWCYYIDHFGDSESGDVIYSCGGDTKRAPYTISTVAGKASCVIDTESAIDVVPRTIYEEEAEDADFYAAMESEKLYQPGQIPIYERFIHRTERENAPAGSFAGKGKSFPILKPTDVMASVRALSRAGTENYDAGTIKRRIVKIAQVRGWHKHLPKAWQADGQKENAVNTDRSNGLQLVESAATLDRIVLREARTDYEIKLMGPGKGSSAWYPAEVLKRDGPKVFKAGTHVYLNHATAAEEAARPEGDVANLAGVLTTQATYSESHAKGPGLYARMKVFADHAQVVEEKAPHVGMSIRAGGTAEGMREGLPLLKEFTHAQSVDVVTRAGAGGMILTEAAVTAPPTQQEDSMDAAELTKLQESLAAQSAINQRLLERAIRGDAREEAVKILRTTSLIETARDRVIDTVLRGEIPQTAGVLDVAKFAAIVNEAAKAEGNYVAALIGSGQVRGMGVAPAPVQVDAAEAERQKQQRERNTAQTVEAYRNIGLSEAAAKRAAERGAAA
jgi:hypothetical protein